MRGQPLPFPSAELFSMNLNQLVTAVCGCRTRRKIKITFSESISKSMNTFIEKLAPHPMLKLEWKKKELLCMALTQHQPWARHSALSLS